MPTRVELLKPSDEKAWDSFLLEGTSTLLYASIRYRNLLSRFTGAVPFYFVARYDTGGIRGVLPAFMFQNEKHGPVLNSLPFYGSNGGIIEHAGDPKVRQALLAAFNELAAESRCVSSTLITSPFEENVAFYEEETQFTFRDSRIGQVSPLPGSESALMEQYHSKTRNMVRKSQRMGFEVAFEPASAVMPFIAETHRENLTAIGGRFKSAAFFDLVSDVFTDGRDFRILTARMDGRLVAGLLLFYFNKTVEYFTPVIVEEFRSRQPLSLLIYEGMKHAGAEGFTQWNWGGTWHAQDGVYLFKKRWGARDLPYHYFTRILDDAVLSLSRDQMLAEYPSFFVVPFDRLRS